MLQHRDRAARLSEHIVGGRAWFGIGAGYQDDEARAMGLPLPAATEVAQP
ncbi:hypothetical protein OG874_29005 [Nocardia sp. NBC_00565]|nr:hypothetical protein [Nocardia sp. NBC_00565]WUC00863.1 hypothetical protein OG874_29005 [Nocardia sp. NBC_00565]